MIQIDRYTVTARFLPAAVIATPLALAVFTWAPFEMGLTKGAAAVFVMTALAYVLSHPTREAGRKLEERLWPSWGGAPSITFLRHRDPTIDPITKARFYNALMALKAVPSLPTLEAELLEPTAADHAYAAVSTWLRGQTRDRKAFPLVFEENVNYGYQRNLLACRVCGLAACGVGLLSAIIAFYFGRHPIAETAVTALLTLYLGFSVTEEGLRRQAGTYARRLIEAIDDIASAPKQPPKKIAPAKRRTRPSGANATL
jgi:hypothetical protein